MNKPSFSDYDFSQGPFLAVWETTRSCALRCKHCRAESINERDPQELDREEAFDLMREISLFDPKPVVILTGGDPLRRPDIFDIVEYGNFLGMRMCLSPSGTNEMTKERIERLKACGAARLSISLDGSCPEVHDAFRGVEGSFKWTTDMIRWANDCDLSLQINTSVSRLNLHDVENIFNLLHQFNIVIWSIFCVVPVGRGRELDMIRGREYEELFNRMAEWAVNSPFDIKTTEAPHFRRVLIQKRKAMGGRHGHLKKLPVGVYRQEANDVIGRAVRGMNDGNGFVFISHHGEICPSGFLPLSAGNVRIDSLRDVYRNAGLFKSIRNAELYKGKCGLCEYRFVCGGSRARAYAMTGDYSAADPLCPHVPKGYEPTPEEMKYW